MFISELRSGVEKSAELGETGTWDMGQAVLFGLSASAPGKTDTDLDSLRERLIAFG
jgi:hypothetical protein